MSPFRFVFKIDLKNLSGKRPECQIVWIQIRTDVMSGLVTVVWFQPVCKEYQQKTLAVNKVNENAFKDMSCIPFHLK